MKKKIIDREQCWFYIQNFNNLEYINDKKLDKIKEIKIL